MQRITITLDIPAPHFSEELAQLLAVNVGQEASKRHPLAITGITYSVEDIDEEISDEELADELGAAPTLPSISFESW